MLVDPLLVARLDAKSLLGSAGRLVVALVGIVVVAALDRGLLRARRERPCGGHAAEHRDELPPRHSITSSASASSLSGTFKPSALAALRLMTSSYLVGACTGMSAGFSPLRMRSTYVAARRKLSARSAVGQQAANFGEKAEWIDSRETISMR